MATFDCECCHFTGLSLVWFNVLIGRLQVISQTIFTDTGAKDSAFSTNHLADTNKTKHNSDTKT